LTVDGGAKVNDLRAFVVCGAVLLLGLACPGAAIAQTAPGTRIDNTAQASYLYAGNPAPLTLYSNTVSTTVLPAPSGSTVAILRYGDPASATLTSSAGPTQCHDGTGYVTLGPPRFANGTSANALQPLPLVQTDTVHAGDAVFLEVHDADRNRDATALDTLDVTVGSVLGDSEQVRLTETGVNTGVFVGYIQTATAASAVRGNCILETGRDSRISLAYTDPDNSTDTGTASALVDPYGLVFDSLTGLPVNGVRVRLVNASTGAAAVVYGDDGASTYPPEMTTGGAVTDSGGTTYSFPAGVFRFPIVNPGLYRLVLTTPAGYSFASTRSIAELNQLGGAPYRLGPASFGADFRASAPSASAIDVPVDPAGTSLFLSKSTLTTIAAPGDFVQYVVKAQNAGGNAPIANVVVTDVLPRGLRYQAGSARLDGAKVADPAIASDGRTLSFNIGTLAASAGETLTYVVEVTVEAREDKLTNSAQAGNGAGVSSNTAQATIRVRNDFFSDTSFVVGRVTEGSCEQDSTQGKGVEGVKVYLEDGRYSVTDKDGKYHFEGVPAGSHVVQMDGPSIPETLEPQLCAERMHHAGRSYSQFVDLRAGALARADFVLKKILPPEGQLRFDMRTGLTGDTEMQHTVRLQVDALAIRNARLMVSLPDVLEFVPGSAQLEGQGIGDPQSLDGTLVFRLDALDAGSERTLVLRTRLKDGVGGSFGIKAVLLFDTPSQSNQRSDVLENRAMRGALTWEKSSYRFSPHFDVLGTTLSAGDKAQLDRLVAEWRGVKGLRVHAVGHTDKNAITRARQSLYADNYALSRARAAAVVEYLRSGLSLDAGQVEALGKGPDEPIATGTDAASLARNRRVDIDIEGVRITHEQGPMSLLQPRAEAAPLTTRGVVATHATASTAHVNRAPVSSDLHVEDLQPGIAMLQPQGDDLPAISSIKVAIQHGAGQHVELLLNGAPVSALNFDGRTVKGDQSVGLSRWRGIAIQDGDNTLLAIVRNADGSEAQRIERRVHFAGGAVRAELVQSESHLEADGRSRPVVAVRLFDAEGKPARPGTTGGFSVDAPYRSWFEAHDLQDKTLQSSAASRPQFTVDDDGTARIELEPTSQSGMAVLQLSFNERQSQEIRAWLEPQARDWILVGLAEGTAAYKAIAGHAQAAAADDEQPGYGSDGRVAFFAKGRIRGDYLLTMAYDSAGVTGGSRKNLLGTIDPHQYYTLYGDGSDQRFESPSSRKLYLKLERRQFMALFGDFTTGLTVTELARYSRTLTGVKSEYAGKRFGYNAFAADTDQGYVQDELQGDGTSGLYHLTQQNILANSDQLRIEVRDRFRTEVVVKTTTLSRYLDYDIDYLNGTLFFKQPVTSRDADFNPQFIIVDYEVETHMKSSVTAGGRGYARVGGAELGASFINQGSASGDTRLGAVDAKIRIDDSTTLRAEAARSQVEGAPAAIAANAWLTEIRHVSKRLDASAWYRVQENGFGLGQQLGTETGSRKAGADARIRLDDSWSIKAEALDQQVLASNAERVLGSAELTHRTQLATESLGLRHVADSNVAVGDVATDQAFASGSVKVLDQRLTLRASQDLALDGPSKVADYPQRTSLGADWQWTVDTTLFAALEHASGTGFDANMARIGLRTRPWERAQASSSLSQQFTENGARTFQNLGLTQGWQVNDRLGFDLGVDTSRTLAGSGSYTFNANTPFASGTPSSGTSSAWQTGDYTAVSVAGLYRSGLWSLTGRAERRASDTADRWSLTSGFYREAVKGRAFAALLQYLDNQAHASGDTASAILQLSWAWRPDESRWIVLDRLDLKSQRANSVAQQLQSSRIVDNMHVNWLLSTRTQVGMQLGLRYVVTSFDADRYAGSSGLLGLDLRHDLSRHFDIGLHGSAMQSFRSGVGDESLGADIGVTFMKNAWISLGYNVRGVRDTDFDDSHYLAQGPYLRIRIKFDQESFKDLDLGALHRPDADGPPAR
jgi:uncharacterized repeat protein (TIGR01451 family)